MKGFSKSDYILFFLVFAALVWIFLVLPPLSLCSNDEGAKYVQMKNFYLYKSLAIEYPGQQLGFGFEYLLKQQGPFAQRGDKLHCTYPPLFTYLSSLFYPLLGDRVTHFLPLLAFFLSLILLSRTLKFLTQNTFLYYLLLFAFLLGSPIFIYAFTFWEHLPAVFLVVCSLYFLVRYFYVNASKLNLFLSAFIISLASLFRTEVLFLVFSYTVSFGLILAQRRQIREMAALLAGGAVPLTAYVIFNLFYYQHPWVHILYHSPNFQFSFKKSLLLAGIILSGIALAFIYKRDQLDSFLKTKFYSFVPILWLWVVIVLFEQSPIVSLILSFPAILLMFFGISERIERRKDKEMTLGNVILGTVVVFICLEAYFLFHNPDLTVRYCLPVIPFAIIFMAAEHERIFVGKPIYGVLIGFLLFSLIYGLYNFKNDIWRYKWYNWKRIEFLQKYTMVGDVVIFQNNRLMEHGGPLFFDRIYLVSDRPDELTKIFNLLKDRGVIHCYFWTFDSDSFSQKWNSKTIRSDFQTPGFPPYYLFKVFIE